ncbi:LapA family protein [Rhodocyclaceae bacterium]
MRALTWFFRGILFVILLGLAIKNSADVELRFFFDARWQAPLSLVILIAFASGVLAGFLAFFPKWIRQRRQINNALHAAQTAQQKPVAADKLTGR